MKGFKRVEAFFASALGNGVNITGLVVVCVCVCVLVGLLCFKPRCIPATVKALRRCINLIIRVESQIGGIIRSAC